MVEQKMDMSGWLRKQPEPLDIYRNITPHGEQDPAEQLARLVLEHRRRPLPARATALALAVHRDCR